ncbi:hypothetical protein OS493_013049 [Desmophyllum pertusum]|uniref:PHD-type domain-containing protein n=1 Tax=Desmophyllum pertusum TaxID=174260 RepID=A0A9X0CU24_9CNID|nr:hypothetical protein OS493_013049 [Desmophyllum pertusum]
MPPNVHDCDCEEEVLVNKDGVINGKNNSDNSQCLVAEAMNIDDTDVLSTITNTKKRKNATDQSTSTSSKKRNNKGNAVIYRRVNINTYCFCKKERSQKEEDDMVECENMKKKLDLKCPGNRYFHLKCLKLTKVPEEDPWYCNTCRDKM